MNDSLPCRPTILLIEDDPSIAGLLIRYLDSVIDGHDLVILYNATEVFAYLLSGAVPLVITDFALPGMTGLQLTVAIKQHFSKTRVLLITGTSTLEEQAQTYGVDYFLAKPFRLDALERIVREALTC